MREGQRHGGCREKSNYLPASGCYDRIWQAGRAAAYCWAFIIAVHHFALPMPSSSHHNISQCTDSSSSVRRNTHSFPCIMSVIVPVLLIAFPAYACVCVWLWMKLLCAPSPRSDSPVKSNGSEPTYSHVSFQFSQRRYERGRVSFSGSVHKNMQFTNKQVLFRDDQACLGHSFYTLYLPKPQFSSRICLWQGGM